MVFWQSVRVLEIADKLGSVLSALIGLVGLILTVYGLRLQRRAASPAPPPTPTAPPPQAPAVPPQPEPTWLEVPDRADWVPSPEHLPPGSYGGPAQGWGESWLKQGPEIRATAAPRRTVLVLGVVLLAVAVVLAAVTWLL
ncbi:hypothetical protein [Saccharopolyspora spinosa]|uniref:hypothetical protein n=1 Tax=Saccharopolyspora spinosa TaxID=60894 RepID=UPI000C6F4275